MSPKWSLAQMPRARFRKDLWKFFMLLLATCIALSSRPPTQAGNVGANVASTIVSADHSWDEINLEVLNLLGELEKLENEHLKIRKEEWDSMGDDEKTRLLRHNAAVSSGMEPQLRALSRETANQIAVLGEPAVPALLEKLRTISWELNYCRDCIGQSLRQIGRPAVGYLIGALKDGGAPDEVTDAHYVNLIISTLGEIKDPRVVDLLLGLLDKSRTSSIAYTSSIVTALASIGDKRAVEPIISELDRRLIEGAQTGVWGGKNAWLMIACVRALGTLSDERAIPVLQKALNAGPQTTKAGKEYLLAHEAARMLRSWGVQSQEKSGKYRIADAPADAERLSPEESYELSVARILQRLYAAVEKAYADAGLTKEDVQGLVAVQAPPQKLMGKWKAYQETWPPVVKAREAAIQEMASLGPGAVTILLKAIDKTDERRGGDIFVLAMTKISNPGVDALIDGLSHEDAAVRARAAASLGQIRDTRAVEPLVGTLSDPDKTVLNAAVWSLGLLADHRAVEPLLDLWNRQDTIARTELAWALGHIRDRRAAKPIMAPLEEAISCAQKTGNWDMNSWAMRVYAGALGQIGDSQAIPLLKKMLNAGPQRTKGTPKYLVAEAAAEALRLFGLEVAGDKEKGGYQVVEVSLPDETEEDVKRD